MKTFIYKNGRPDHMDGYNDDCLITLGMALWILESSFKKLERLEKQNKAMLNSWVGGGNANQSAVQIELERGTGFVSKDNRHKAAVPKPRFSPLVSRNMQDPTGRFLWLFSGSK
jgi:hypothetical protein